MRHPELAAARANRDFVLKQVCDAVNTISGVAQASGSSEANPYEGAGELAAALDEFDVSSIIRSILRVLNNTEPVTARLCNVYWQLTPYPKHCSVNTSNVHVNVLAVFVASDESAYEPPYYKLVAQQHCHQLTHGVFYLFLRWTYWYPSLSSMMALS